MKWTLLKLYSSGPALAQVHHTESLHILSNNSAHLINKQHKAFPPISRNIWKQSTRKPKAISRLPLHSCLTLYFHCCTCGINSVELKLLSQHDIFLFNSIDFNFILLLEVIFWHLISLIIYVVVIQLHHNY